MPVFTGTNGRNKIEGSVGADTLIGRGGVDRLNGAEGADELYGGRGNDILRGGPGGDTLTGGDGNDTLIPGSNLSEDLILPSIGNDRIDLSGANEGAFYSFDYAAPTDLDGEFGFGGMFLNSVDILVSNSTIRVTKRDFSSNVGTDRVTGLDGLPPSEGGFAQIGIGGTDGNDLIEFDRTDGPGINIFTTRGDDTILGAADTFERLRLASTRDIDGNPVGMVVTLNESIDGQMAGSATLGDDEFAFDYTRYTFSGIDIIEGSSAGEVVIGSSGDDRFRPAQGNDGFDGRDGFDTVEYTSWRVNYLNVDLNEGTATYRYQVGFENALYEDGLRGVEGVVGSHLNDDTIKGASTGNRLEGLGGDDRLVGRGGNDTLIGGDGDDTMLGGAGRDRFVFSGEDGEDRIRGFEDRRDLLVIENTDLRFTDVEITDQGRHTVVTFADSTVKLLNTDHTLLTEADFLFLA